MLRLPRIRFRGEQRGNGWMFTSVSTVDPQTHDREGCNNRGARVKWRARSSRLRWLDLRRARGGRLDSITETFMPWYFAFVGVYPRSSEPYIQLEISDRGLFLVSPVRGSCICFLRVGIYSKFALIPIFIKLSMDFNFRFETIEFVTAYLQKRRNKFRLNAIVNEKWNLRPRNGADLSIHRESIGCLLMSRYGGRHYFEVRARLRAPCRFINPTARNENLCPVRGVGARSACKPYPRNGEKHTRVRICISQPIRGTRQMTVPWHGAS